jgi:hypothetical protein
MVSRLMRVSLVLCAAGSLFFSGWACSKFANKAGISDQQVVATVGDKKITYADWMHQMDFLSILAPRQVDPNNAESVRDVLDSLIDQEVVLSAARASHYTDPTFDEQSKSKLIEVGNQIKDIKDHLAQQIETVNRLEKSYKDSYLAMLLARSYASSRIDSVKVSDQEVKDRYAKYAKQLAEEGQKAPPINQAIEQKVRQTVAGEKLMSQIQMDNKVVKNEDVIQKYLTYLSTSSALLQDQSSPAQPSSTPAASKPGKQ